MGLLEKIFGDWNDKEIKRIEKKVAQIEALDSSMQALSDDELRGKTAEFKERLAKGETLDDILPEAFAVCREAAVRTVGMKPFHVQLIGGIVLHEGNIAEMKTGEGKTLVATLPVYLNALEGKGVHVVTVNDYLASTQGEMMGKIYTFLGLTVGIITNGSDPAARKAAYECDITYGTNNEFGFDYLRDNMAVAQQFQSQRELNFAIVDEVDSILIDEARTPLIISGQGDDSSELYQKANRFVKGLRGRIADPDEKLGKNPVLGTNLVDIDELNKGYDFTVNEKDKSVALTDEGVQRCEKYFGIDNLSDPANMDINHHVLIALKAHNIMKRDTDYIVNNGEVNIVDEFTGRIMYGRRYSDGLHQAIEAKEGIEVRKESRTLATITLQNYFRMYKKLSGMTGTAKTEEEEFTDIYNMQVVVIPTNKPVIRDDMDDQVYATERGKYKAIIEEIVRRHATGQPVLVGTISVEKSELLSEMLKKRGIPHDVLNAKQHMREAEIIAQAGRKGQVTIATNMAGRGTDILLGGNPEFEAKREMKKMGFEEKEISYASSFVPLKSKELLAARDTYHQLLEQFKAECAPAHEEVTALGGLHIIGTERHESRRIDNQLRGRSGRQGDPGSSQFFISLEDDLMRLFGGDRIQGIMGRIGMTEDLPIEAGILSRTIENAQKKVEGRNYGIRRYVLQYDDVMNKQRSVIYEERNRVLHGEDLKEHIESMMRDIVTNIVEFETADSKYAEEWDFADLNNKIREISEFLPGVEYAEDQKRELTPDKLKEDIMEMFRQCYEKKEAEIGSYRMRLLERMLLLRIVDTKWMDHIDAMDQLKTGIGLRSIGQQDPAQAYANEGSDMFDEMVDNIRCDLIRYCFNVSIQTNDQVQQRKVSATERKDDASGKVYSESYRAGAQSDRAQRSMASQMPQEAPKETKVQKAEPVRVEKKPGRNDPCPCGSGKKYKNCCGRNE
ncbi:MAG: preprotein translocase subunit SecA [Clostridia bacterium]|nr:preprotein translocase subunit SecA [Clostridia bacterium]